MSWIILWALYPLSPWRRLHESMRHLLEAFLRTLADPGEAQRLDDDPDDPKGFPIFEFALQHINASIDVLIYQRARAILGLRATSWKRPMLRPQRRRSRSFAELFARLEACIHRFGDIERLAQRRAEKLQRLLAATPALLP